MNMNTIDAPRFSRGWDELIAPLTRRAPRVRGMHRIVRPLRRYFADQYRGRDDRWIEIDDYDGTLRMRLDRSSYIGGCIYWLGYHHLAEASYLARELTPEMVFADVGANQGEFTLLAARRLAHGRVYAFEPASDMYALLQKNVEMNGFTNVELYKVGLGAARDRMALYTNPNPVARQGWNEGLYSTIPADGRTQRVEEVDIVALDEVLADVSPPRLDFLKIDVEGAELQVILGAADTIAHFGPALLIEINEAAFRAAGYSGKELLAILADYGYSFSELDAHGEPRPFEASRSGARAGSFDLLCRRSLD